MSVPPPVQQERGTNAKTQRRKDAKNVFLRAFAALREDSSPVFSRAKSAKIAKKLFSINSFLSAFAALREDFFR